MSIFHSRWFSCQTLCQWYSMNNVNSKLISFFQINFKWQFMKYLCYLRKADLFLKREIMKLTVIVILGIHVTNAGSARWIFSNCKTIFGHRKHGIVIICIDDVNDNFSGCRQLWHTGIRNKCTHINLFYWFVVNAGLRFNNTYGIIQNETE